jgi:uncharacterized protein (DUF433 family)
MSTSDVAASSWIQKTPGVIGGDACVRNTRIAVWMLLDARNLGMTDETIRDRYQPPLTQADLNAAWSYYEQHREEVELALKENYEDD